MNTDKNTKDILLKVLGMIGYQGNKEEFINQFLKNCTQQALLDLCSQLSKDKEQQLTSLQQENLDSNNIIEKIEDIVGIQEFKSSLQKTTEIAFTEYFNEINPTLSNTQKDQLQSYFQTLQA